jgi:effector-binding domain-containing protein
MPTHLRLLTAAAFALLPLLARAQEAAAPAFPAAEEILDALQRRARGAATIERVETITSAGRIEFVLKVPTRQEHTGTFREQIHRDGRSRFRVEMKGFYESDGGCDGEVVWEADAISGVVIKEGEDRAIEQRLTAMFRGAPWREHYSGARTVGLREIDGAAHAVIEMTPRTGDKETWYVQRDPAELRKIEMRMNMGGGSREDVTFRYGEYAATDGILYPRMKHMAWGYIEIAFRYDSIEHNVEIPDQQFALPDKVAEVAAARARDGAVQRPAGSYEITTVPERHVALIRATVKHDDIGTTMAAILPEVFAFLEEQEVSITGPPFSRFVAHAQDEVVLEAGFPVGAVFESGERVKAGTLPAGKTVTAWHNGPYEGLAAAHEALSKWLQEQGLAANGSRWEVYWTNPGTQPDQTKWRTQLFCPVK